MPRTTTPSIAEQIALAAEQAGGLLLTLDLHERIKADEHDIEDEMQDLRNELVRIEHLGDDVRLRLAQLDKVWMEMNNQRVRALHASQTCRQGLRGHDRVWARWVNGLTDV